MQAMPILTLQAAGDLLKALEDFLDKSEANFCLIIDRGGNLISQQGPIPEGADASIVGALAAGSFAATRELALRIGEPEFSALFQQGANFSILINAVDEDVILVTAFTTQTTVGLVRFYSARAVKRIATLLADLRANPPEVEPLFTERDLASTGNRIFG